MKNPSLHRGDAENAEVHKLLRAVLAREVRASTFDDAPFRGIARAQTSRAKTVLAPGKSARRGSLRQRERCARILFRSAFSACQVLVAINTATSAGGPDTCTRIRGDTQA